MEFRKMDGVLRRSYPDAVIISFGKRIIINKEDKLNAYVVAENPEYAYAICKKAEDSTLMGVIQSGGLIF